MKDETKSTATPAYLWFDSEFTSLEPEHGRLLQVALVVTDSNLKRLSPPDDDVSLCIRLEDDAVVSDWVKKNLASLLERCRSSEAVSLEEADRRLAALIDRCVGAPSDDIRRRPFLAGNTVYMDVSLAKKNLPEFSRRFHYRLIDISTVKTLWANSFKGPEFDKAKPELIRQHLPDGMTLPDAGEHDASFDVFASISELNFYLSKLTKKS